MKLCNDLVANDVPASGQLKEDESVSVFLRENADCKILFLGNSITRHGVAEAIGWRGDWGMAASKKENDYVHRLIARLEEDGKRVSYCIANCSDWERSWDFQLLSKRYASARAFGADIVVVRLGENAGLLDRAEQFMPRYEEMVSYFAGENARVVLTDLFWEYEPFDIAVQELAKKKGYAFAQLHDLGRDDQMKALGEFSHAGVAIHPGDKGMAEIAERIYKALGF